MAYDKTEWKARQGANLNRFRKSQETNNSVVLHNIPDLVTEPGTPFNTENMNKIEQGIYDAHEGLEAEAQARAKEINEARDQLNGVITQEAARIGQIESKIPNQASSANQLADKEFVLTSIQDMSSGYVTETADMDTQWPSFAVLEAGPWYINGIAGTPNSNNYAIYIEEDNSVWRAKFINGKWSKQYKVHDVPFSPAELAAMNSGVTAAIVTLAQSALQAGTNISATPGATENTSKFGTGTISQKLGDWFAQIAQKVNGIITGLKAVTGDLTVHVDNSVKHITEDERVAWNSGNIQDFSVQTRHIADEAVTREKLNANVFDALYPVGTIYECAININPAQLFGGTWTVWGRGRVSVCVDPNDTDFNDVRRTGGAKTHVLTQQQMPAHTHIQNAHAHSGRFGGGFLGNSGHSSGGSGGAHSFDGNGTSANTATNQNTGGGQAHNNMPPYITSFKWERTA